MYTKRDQELLAEAYTKVDEGLLSRLKTRGSQAVGTAKGIGKKLGGAAKQFGGSTLSKVADLGGKALGVDTSQGGLAQKGAQLSKVGKKDISAGGRMGQEAKYSSGIQNVISELVSDLSKLGMEVADPQALQQELQTVLKKHLSKVNTKSGQLTSAKGHFGSKVV